MIIPKKDKKSYFLKYSFPLGFNPAFDNSLCWFHLHHSFLYKKSSFPTFMHLGLGKTLSNSLTILKSLLRFSLYFLVFFLCFCNRKQSIEALISLQLSSFLPFFIAHNQNQKKKKIFLLLFHGSEKLESSLFFY
jgi:hypothetical protein